MTRRKRDISSSDVYHIIVRGAGRRLLFENDYDRQFFLNKLYEFAGRDKSLTNVCAWCLMENHVHMLMKSEAQNLTSLMRSLNTSFARYYNGRYGHVGPVFQGRYISIPVETEAQLLETVRYIHHNPHTAGICDYDKYEWSSYQQFFKANLDDDLSWLLDVFGSIKSFVKFHENLPEGQTLLEFEDYGQNKQLKRRIVPDGDAILLVKNHFGSEFAGSIAAMPRKERDLAIIKLRSMGLTVRQIERLTGIGRGVIQNCRVT